MKLDELKTLTDLTLKDLMTKLDAQLPDRAYKAIGGTKGKDGEELTDIDPNYMNDVLVECFGTVGIGHGFTYDPAHLTVQNTGETGMKAWIAYLLQGAFWYVLVDATGTEHTFTIQHSGGSQNGRAEYAAKGALTSALAGAVSKLGFQKSVYLGLRSHKTVGKKTGTGKTSPSTVTKKVVGTCSIHTGTPIYEISDGTTTKVAHKLDDGKWCYGPAARAKPEPANKSASPSSKPNGNGATKPLTPTAVVSTKAPTSATKVA